MRGQRGAGIGLMIILLLAIGMVAVLATYVLSRLTGSRDELTTTQRRLARAQEALEQYAATAHRLPCPAQPTVDDGVEVPPNSDTCTYPEGTLPWRTLGLGHDEGYDGWYRKLSYRVYAGNQGSLTQPEGINMFHCDDVDGSPGGLTPKAGNAGGLCIAKAERYQRNSTTAQFLAGKGFSLSDQTVTPVANYPDVAYVILSHGSTGLGAYSVSGARLDLPVGDERNNTQSSGAFTSRPFSDPDTSATNALHFDDILAYRRITDLATRIGLGPRDWPEGATFNANTMAAATGSGAYRDNVGGSFSFMGNTFRATGGTGSFSFTTSGGMEGIGIAGGMNNLINNGEVVRVDFNSSASRTAFTLSNFGKLFASTFIRERVIVRFYNGGTQVGGDVTKQACSDDGGAATFVVDPTIPGATFDRVDLEGQTSTFLFDSSFLLSEIAACAAKGTCDTTIAAYSTACKAASLSAAAFSPATITNPAASLLTFTIDNGTDRAGQNGIALVGTLPSGLVIADATLGGTCGGTLTAPSSATSGVVVGSGSFKILGMSIANNAAGCTAAVSVTSATPGSYRHEAGNVTATSNLINEISAPATLTIQ